VIHKGSDPHVRQAQASAWNIANALTISRMALVPLFAWLLLYDDGHLTSYRLFAFGVFVVATATDRVDGYLARSRGIVTDFGKVSDPIADKALMGMALAGLSIIGLLPWWVTAVVLVREFGITALAVPGHPARRHARQSRWQGQDRPSGGRDPALRLAAEWFLAHDRRRGHGVGGRRNRGNRR